MISIKVPAVGESITEVTISQWMKQEGDYVEMDEVICELESDKAAFELRAEAAGTLHRLAEEGDALEIGAELCQIDESKEAPAPASAALSSTPAAEIVEMKAPAVGESITEVTLSSWMKNDGDIVALDEPIAEIESDKAAFELTAQANGKLTIVAQEGDTVEIGSVICTLEVTEAAPASAGSAAAPAAGAAAYASGHPSPAAAKILAEKGVSPEEVTGTGVGGRISKQDAQAAEKQIPEAAPAPAAEQPLRVYGAGREQRRRKLSPLRKTVARRLVAVKNETAMLTTFNEVDMKPIIELRKKYKEPFKEKYEVGLGFMSFFTKACCQALQEWPAVNAMIDEDEMVYNDYCDISIAVSAPKGLVVPVVRNAESMSFDQIEREILRLANKARNNKLSIDEMQGGTFTITNGGVFGSMMSTPIINAPQSAILGMHNIVQRPTAVNAEVVIRPMMYLALSYDHRIIDGRESVSFLVRVKELLEDPARLMLGI